MKPLTLFTLICLSIGSLTAQTKLPLSPTPTLAELKSLFTATGKGEYKMTVTFQPKADAPLAQEADGHLKEPAMMIITPLGW